MPAYPDCPVNKAIEQVSVCIVTEYPGVVSTPARPYKTGKPRRDEMSLLRPDDSLAAHEDLASMAMMSSQPTAPCNVTKLVLPPELTGRLDPSQLPPSESDDGYIMYHVTTAANDTQVTWLCGLLLSHGPDRDTALCIVHWFLPRKLC